VISAYFDESSDGKSGAGFFTVAGYVLTGSKRMRLESEWKRMLVHYRLDFFRMSDCNSGTGSFSHLSEQECDECARRAIKIARENTLHGVAYVLTQENYQAILQDKGFDCDSYTFLVWTALLHMAKWRDGNRPRHRLALSFEKGYSTQRRATELLEVVSGDPRFKKAGGATLTSFFDKAASYPGQAADLIAWHVRKGYTNTLAEKPIRRDTKALFDGLSVKTIHFDQVQLTILRDKFVRHSGTLKRASRILFNPNGPLLAE
jgi:hypothetical protein